MIFLRYILFVGVLFFSFEIKAQNHYSKAEVRLDVQEARLFIYQEITYYNSSENVIDQVVLNDWNHAFSSKNSPLAQRFSDEFVRSFYYASNRELGETRLIQITDHNNQALVYTRHNQQIDLIEVSLSSALAPHESTVLKISYEVKVPSNKFTDYGYSPDGGIEIKDWILFPARYQNNDFIRYSNENLDDAPHALTDFDIVFKTSENVVITSNLSVRKEKENQYFLTGSSVNGIHLIAEPQATFQTFRNHNLEVETNLFDENIDEFITAIIIDKVVNFVSQKTGGSMQEKIVVSQADYKRNPFYGLNQLPSFLRPFPDNFLYEIKFLKTFSENYIQSNLNIDFRKDNWIANAIEMYLIMEYLQSYYPEMKMLGNLSKLGILQGYYGTKMDFEDQFYYLYLMMARRNLDQAPGSPKNELIKFNEQISSKYKAGLDLRYLDDYLGESVIDQAITTFFKLNQQKYTSEKDFQEIIAKKTDKNIDWYFNQVVPTRNLIDYKISKVRKRKDSLEITLTNKAGANVPISVFGLKNDSVIFKKWYANIQKDSTFSIKNHGYDKLALNYDQKIPEYNIRNNFKSLKTFNLNRPLKFTFIKDFENPQKNQVFFMPDYRYNLYNGFAPGLRLSSSSMLKKPLMINVSTYYSFLQQSLIGSGYVGYENLIREGNLYSVNYALQANHYHYAPDATYTRIIPSVLFRIREPNFRDNKLQSIYVRYVNVNRQESNFAAQLNNRNYSVFNLRYNNIQTEITKHFRFSTDIQVSSLFGKLSSQIEFRRLYENNRQLNLRFFGGLFTHRSTDSDFFSFATDRPTDYLFDYNFYGRSESSGFFSQQYITAEGGFKSKLTPYANQWIFTTNASFNIWNWIEIYSDLGFIKNKYKRPEFLYDSGIRLNLVTDYFEVYFPVYSNLGWEISEPNYAERIRFVVTLNPNALVNLFTRKWL